MKAFSLLQPKSVDDAVRLMDRARRPEPAGGRKFLAGGQDLLTEMKEHLTEPEELINLKSIAGLDRIAETGGALTIGALCTLSKLAETAPVRERLRVLREAALSVASPQIRSQGTVGGNLCQRPRCWYYRNEHARCLKKGGTECFAYSGLNKYNAILGGGPSYIVHPSDLAPALVVLDARVTIAGPAGTRALDLSQFFKLPSDGDATRENVLQESDVLTQVDVPAPEPGLVSTYVKFKERGSFDFALSAVALALWFDGDRVRRARVCLGGVAPIPWRAEAAEKVLTGQKLDPDVMKAAADAAVQGAEPLEMNKYKVPLTKGLVIRALESIAHG
jgi:xanthine dehydrogenase YagS FAD-binding subunit